MPRGVYDRKAARAAREAASDEPKVRNLKVTVVKPKVPKAPKIKVSKEPKAPKAPKVDNSSKDAEQEPTVMTNVWLKPKKIPDYITLVSYDELKNSNKKICSESRFTYDHAVDSMVYNTKNGMTMCTMPELVEGMYFYNFVR